MKPDTSSDRSVSATLESQYSNTDISGEGFSAINNNRIIIDLTQNKEELKNISSNHIKGISKHVQLKEAVLD